MNPLGTLYRRRNWVGVVPPKIWGEMPAVGSPSHRRTWETKRRLEHLIRRCGLRSTRTVTGHAKWHSHMWKSKKRVELIIQGQNPLFSLDKRKKLMFWGAIVGYRNLNKVIALRVILMAEGAIIMPRRSHLRTIRPCQWHITRGGHIIEKELRRRG